MQVGYESAKTKAAREWLSECEVVVDELQKGVDERDDARLSQAIQSALRHQSFTEADPAVQLAQAALVEVPYACLADVFITPVRLDSVRQ